SPSRSTKPTRACASARSGERSSPSRSPVCSSSACAPTVSSTWRRTAARGSVPRPPPPSPLLECPHPPRRRADLVRLVHPPPAIFREYDIRGTVGDQLTAEVARAIGQAIATLGWERLGRAPRMAVGRDNRPSGTALAHGVTSGIEAVGGHAVDVGVLPTPALYFATHVLNVDGGVQVTGSHNPPEFNGFKLVLGPDPIYGAEIQGLRRLIEEGRTPG